MANRIFNNVIRIPTSLSNRFFRYWLDFLEPFHGLTPREKDVATEFLKQRFELSRSITDEALLDKVVMSNDTKAKIREDCGISVGHFQVIMGKLKDSGFIKEDKVNPKFIPKNIDLNSKNFQLLLYFDFTGQGN